MSLSTNFPTVNPTLNLNFLNAGVLDSRITFSRGSTATYFDQLGVLQTAQNNIPRFDYSPSTLAAQGLLIEEQRTNLLLQSEDFATTWTTSNSSITTNSTTAPSAASTADTLVENTANAEHYVQQQYTVGTNANFSFSVFVKAAGRTVVRLFALGDRFGGVAQAFVFDLVAVTATSNNGTSTGTITSVGNGWFRCVMNMPTTTTTGVLTLRIMPQSGANSSYTGDGTSGVFLWGAQLEAGAFPTSYIPTTTTALTRNADVASMTGTNFSSWFNAAAGVMFVEWTTVGNDPTNNRGIASIDDGSNNNRVALFIPNSFTPLAVAARVVSGGTATNPANSGSIALSSTAKTALAYGIGTDQAALCVNGASPTTASPVASPVSVNNLRIGAIFGVTQIGGWIRKVSYYPVRLPNSTLQALTA